MRDGANFMETILILEDETFVRELLALFLRLEGYTILEASTVAEAEQVISSHSVEALVADVVLPGPRNGIEFARGLIGKQPTFRMVFISGWPLRGMYEKALSRLPPGSFALLQKPVERSALVHQIRALLHDARRGAG